jgi:diacylglycerol kinase family enzyme
MLNRPITPNQNYAVVLNANAGRMTSKLRDRIQNIVPLDKLHFTESLLHSRDVLQKCIKDGCETIFAGGGDGTIVDVLNAIEEFTPQGQRKSTVGVLRLGTGNALAYWLNASTDPVKDLQKWLSGKTHGIIDAPMLEAEDTLFPFAGIGVDAAVLNDYNIAKRELKKNALMKHFAKGIPGYVYAGYTKTLPEAFRRPKHHVKVINTGRPAFRIGPNGGEIGEAIPTGAVIYEGEVSTVTCATTPYYGYKMKMFPFATKRKGRFQLRVVEMAPWEIAYNIYPCWNGTLRHPKLIDYYADRVRVIFDEAMPYQLGGEASGYRKEVTFSLKQGNHTMLQQI